MQPLLFCEIWCSLVTVKEQPPRDACIIKAKLQLHYFCLTVYLGFPSIQGSIMYSPVCSTPAVLIFSSQYQEKNCISKTPTSTMVTTSSQSPLGTPINTVELCSVPKGFTAFYFCHRRNVIKLKLVNSMEHRVYLHTVLSKSGSKLTLLPQSHPQNSAT